MENMKRNATIVAIYRALSSLLETHNFDSIRSMTSADFQTKFRFLKDSTSS